MNAFIHAPTRSCQRSRHEAAEKIHLTMIRFPLILKILRSLSEAEVPLPGDDDIRHGCERALTAILVEIARLDPAAPGKTSPAEETVRSWLDSAEAVELVDGDVLQRMEQFIDCVLDCRTA